MIYYIYTRITKYFIIIYTTNSSFLCLNKYINDNFKLIIPLFNQIRNNIYN